MEKEEVATATQRYDKHISAANNQHATIKKLPKAAFSSWFAPKLYSEDQREKFVNVKFLGTIIGYRITRRLLIEIIEEKIFRTFIRIYSLFKSDRISANIKLTLNKALIRLDA
jgi:hypothetical protein